MTTPCILELVEELFQYYDDIDCAVTVDQRITAREQAELWLKRILTSTHQAGIDEANKKMFDDIKADIASLEYDTDGDTFKKIVLSRLSSQTWFEALQDKK